MNRVHKYNTRSISVDFIEKQKKFLQIFKENCNYKIRSESVKSKKNMIKVCIDLYTI